MKAINIVCMVALIGAMMVMPVVATTETFSPGGDCRLDQYSPNSNYDHTTVSFFAYSKVNFNRRSLFTSIFLRCHLVQLLTPQLFTYTLEQLLRTKLSIFIK